MGYGVKFIVKGQYALFTRPEMKVERVSYDVPTPSALEGLLKSVYWHPGVKYIIDKIYVYNPIKFINIRRNEVNEKLSATSVKQLMNGGSIDVSIYSKDSISQRASLLLKDVCYGIEAHFVLTDEKDEDMTEEKCYNILIRRLKKGQWFKKPCLGCREFPAEIESVDELPTNTLNKSAEFGYMLYDMQYKKDAKGNYTDCAEPRFYKPKMEDGIIDVACYAKELLC